MRINGFIGVSLIEYPNKISSVIYTSPCNFRCPYCHNPELVFINHTTLNENDILEDLQERASFIDGVSITGGEPLLQEDLFNFLKHIKNLNLPVKIDTNGYYPGKIKQLIEDGLVDYIAMDIKTSLKKYNNATGIEIDISKIIESVNIIKQSKIDYEFRTTAVPEIVDENDFNDIGELVKGAKLFSIQQYDNSMTLNSSFKDIKPYKDDILKKFYNIMKKYVKKVKIKNIAIPV
ncbi:MAG: anaerobic ribonucleoside-triphosphate reductase activating protein [Candidatus Goldbacteria bacterium]|nr:anaerobic ribonucleoside-triphosphate reductase activating protein [Candidatus Goldiibacteriota bacterium]